MKNGRSDISLIQVAYDLDSEKTRRRELDSLERAMKELKLNKSLILTEDTEDEIKIGSKPVVVRPIYKWLLEQAV